MVAPVTSPSNSRRARAQGTRAAIFAAAGPIFAEHGLSGARTEMIAAAAGVTKSLLFYYFRDLHGLYAAVLVDQFSVLHQEVMAILAEPGSPRSILFRYLDQRFDRVSEKRRSASLHHQLFTSSNQTTRQILRRYAIPQNRALGLLLARGIREGEFRKVDIRHTIISLNALIVFYFSIAPAVKLAGDGVAYGEADLKSRKQHVLDFVRHGLFSEPRAMVP